MSDMDASGPLIGIDLGTTMTVAAYFDGAVVKFVRNDVDDICTPSIVAFDPVDGLVTVGRAWRLAPEEGVLPRERRVRDENKLRAIGMDEPCTPASDFRAKRFPYVYGVPLVTCPRTRLSDLADQRDHEPPNLG